MKKQKSSSIGVLALSMSIVGTIIGVNFATGREVLTYFVNFGTMGYFGLAIAFACTALICQLSYRTAVNMNVTTFDYVVSPRGWKPIRIFFIFYVLIGLFSALSSMIAGTGALLQAIFGVPYVVGALFMVALAAASALLPINRFADSMGFMVPVMVVVAIVICVLCAVSPSAAGGEAVEVTNSNSILSGWLMAGFVYFGYNIGPVRAMIIPMAKDIKDGKTSLTAAILGCGILFVVSCCAMAAILSNYSICKDASLPIIILAGSKSKLLALLYAIIAVVAIYTTVASYLQVFKATLSKIKPLGESKTKMGVTLLIMTLAAFALSFIGFTTFVDKVFAVLGITAWIGIAFSIYNYFYYKKHPVVPAAEKAE